MASAAVWGAIMLRADAKREPQVGNPADYGPLTGTQYAASARAAQTEVVRSRARLTSATAIVRRGHVKAPNLSAACTSGHVIRILLVGRFPRLDVHGPRTAHGVLVTADARSGEACDRAVMTGHVKRYRHGADLLPVLATGR